MSITICLVIQAIGLAIQIGYSLKAKDANDLNNLKHKVELMNFKHPLFLITLMDDQDGRKMKELARDVLKQIVVSDELRREFEVANNGH